MSHEPSVVGGPSISLRTDFAARRLTVLPLAAQGQGHPHVSLLQLGQVQKRDRPASNWKRADPDAF